MLLSLNTNSSSDGLARSATKRLTEELSSAKAQAYKREQSFRDFMSAYLILSRSLLVKIKREKLILKSPA